MDFAEIMFARGRVATVAVVVVEMEFDISLQLLQPLSHFQSLLWLQHRHSRWAALWLATSMFSRMQETKTNLEDLELTIVRYVSPFLNI